MKKKLVVLSGAGISAESGLKTFRDSDGLWEGHRVEDVATLEGFKRDPEKVLRFYNERRRQMFEAFPNRAHILLAELEKFFNVWIVTQNVDDLHERAGSHNVIHLHGELLKARSSVQKELVYPWTKDILIGDLCEHGFQLRPHIVWFGEEVPLIALAAEIVKTADLLVVIGTSLQVYPAAGLIAYASDHASIFYIDPKPMANNLFQNLNKLQVIADKATVGMELVYQQLMNTVHLTN